MLQFFRSWLSSDSGGPRAQPGDQCALPTLKTGQCAEILHVTEDSADDEAALKLKRMGLCEGRRIELLRNGDPLTLRVAGTRIGLSRQAAKAVQVRVCSACAAAGDLAASEPEGATP